MNPPADEIICPACGSIASRHGHRLRMLAVIAAAVAVEVLVLLTAISFHPLPNYQPVLARLTGTGLLT